MLLYVIWKFALDELWYVLLSLEITISVISFSFDVLIEMDCISFTGLSLKYLAVDLQSSSWNIDTTVGIDKHVFSPTSAKYE